MKTVSLVLGFAMIILAGWIETVSLIFAGVGFFGIYSILLGSETIQYRYHSLEPDSKDPIEKYREWGDVAQGAILITLGVVLLGLYVSLYLGISQTLIRFMVRRPGVVLLALSMVCFLRAINIIANSKQKTGISGVSYPSTFFHWVEYFFSRLIPTGFFLVLGMVLFGIGVFETVTPSRFDLLGGGFIESIIGGW
jgi:hypothetical protein